MCLRRVERQTFCLVEERAERESTNETTVVWYMCSSGRCVKDVVAKDQK